MPRYFVRLALLPLAMVAGLLTGCSGETPTASKDAISTVSKSPSPSSIEEVVRASPPVIGPPASVSKAASGKFGAAGVATGYKAITAFAAANAVKPEVINIPREEVTAADLASPKSMMTADAAASWDKNTANLEGDHTYANLSGVMPYGMNGNGYSIRTDVDQPAITISDGAVGVAPNGRMHVSFDIVQTVRLEAPAGKYQKYSLNRTMEYWLSPGTSPRTPWLIDGWQARYDHTDPVADVR